MSTLLAHQSWAADKRFQQLQNAAIPSGTPLRNYYLKRFNGSQRNIIEPYVGHAEAWFNRADLMMLGDVPEATSYANRNRRREKVYRF